MFVLIAYAVLIPLVALHLPGVGGVGAADLLMPVGFATVLLLRWERHPGLSHVALCGFMLVALLSLLMIDDRKIAMDCTIRWIRLTSIVVPFFFGLFVPIERQQLSRLLLAYGIGGGLAILIGIVVHVLQIEIRNDQQKLWMDGGYQLRAGGLIGNSGAFGHLTATWCVTSVGALCLVRRAKHWLTLSSAVVLISLYTIYIASSRATALHLITGLGTVGMMLPSHVAMRRHLLCGAIVAALVLALPIALSQFRDQPAGNSCNAVMTNLERFVPGLNGGDMNEFTSNRAGNWPEYIAMMSDSWLLGSGYKTGVRMHEESPDNSYLSVMLETGLAGFLCMSLFVMSVFYRLIGLHQAGDRYAGLLLPVCVGQLTHCLTSDIYTFWITMPVVYLLLGLVVVRSTADQIGESYA